MFFYQRDLMEKHRASCGLNYTDVHARVVIGARGVEVYMTIAVLSLTDILVIRPQYQKIVRRTVARLPILNDSRKIRVKSIGKLLNT